MPEPSQYFSEQPDVASDPKLVDVLLDDITLTLNSDAGVFSHGQLDQATRVFLESAPRPPESGTIVDIGCGYGPIALTVAVRSPHARVVAVDVNQRALELTRSNAERNGLTNVETMTPDEAADLPAITAIYSNPPIRIGKRALHDLMLGWLGRLEGSAPAYFVVGKHLGSDSLAAWLTGEGYVVRRLVSRKSYRVLDVRREEDS